MFPFKSNIIIDRNLNRNIYLQICDQIIKLIKSGKLPPSIKLPGSRKLADDLNIHRKTVIAAYEELLAQNWIETFPSKGTYISSNLPIITPTDLKNTTTSKKVFSKTGFTFYRRPHLVRDSMDNPNEFIEINDGVPDYRLTPIDDIAKIYRNITKKTQYRPLLKYSSIYGNQSLRETLVSYLNETRGIHISVENILITRGSQMGIFLASQLLLRHNNIIITGNTNYMTADTTFIDTGGIIERISVDHNGLDVGAIEKICKAKQIQAVFVTPHHHYPTTVPLSAKRRMRLLELAEIYNFAIIEDDYDYDFHYSNSPILPLASSDYNGNVIYIGGVTKIIAPAMRIGYLIAPKEFIDEAANLRRIVDRQGDTILEQAFSIFIKSGDFKRQNNKVLKIYKARRDLFCSLLQEKLSEYFEFETPKGGMAVWVKLNKKYNWNIIRTEARKQNLILTDWKRYDNDHSMHNGIRMGFTSLNEEEIHLAIDKLQNIMRSVKV